jgi:hypothetical protein
MSFVTALPAELASAAGEVQTIGCAVAAGSMAPATATTGVVPAAADEVSELKARVNDDGWESCFVNWLKSSLRAGDAVLVFSVGGGNSEKSISGNIVHAVRHAKRRGDIEALYRSAISSAELTYERASRLYVDSPSVDVHLDSAMAALRDALDDVRIARICWRSEF